MLGDGHVRFGRRLGETDRSKDPHRAPSRPHVALCHSRQEALEVKARLADWLAPRGLSFNEDKTRVVSLDEGFDFLGLNVRRYGPKSLIKPSKAAQRRIRERLRDELRSLRGTNAQAVRGCPGACRSLR